MTVRPFIPIYSLFVFELGRHRRYERPKKVQRGSTTSIILKAQRSQTLDRRSGSGPALHFLLVEALMTSSLSQNAPRLRIDIRWERQTLARWYEPGHPWSSERRPTLPCYSNSFQLLVFYQYRNKENGLKFVTAHYKRPHQDMYSAS